MFYCCFYLVEMRNFLYKKPFQKLTFSLLIKKRLQIYLLYIFSNCLFRSDESLGDVYVRVFEGGGGLDQPSGSEVLEGGGGLDQPSGSEV